MNKYLDCLPKFIEDLREIKETILTNIILIGQVPSPTFKENNRATIFMDRLAEFQVDECTIDGYRNPIGIIRGRNPLKPPIFMVAHLDTFVDREVDHNFTIKENVIIGPGILDNSVGVGVLTTMPEIFRRLNLTFESDIVLAGVIQSLGKGNLRGVRHLLKMWNTPIRGAVIVEGGEIGRLNYYADGMVRCDIECNVSRNSTWEHRLLPNAILVLNDVMNEILKLRLPQKPKARVVMGKIAGGYKHGIVSYDGSLGLEIQSDSDKMVKSLYNEIKDIVDGIGHEYRVELKLKTISNVQPARLKYNHPLVKSSVAVMKRLGLTPVSEASESELSIFLSQRIPTVTLGITHGKDYHLEDAKMEIEPMFKGIAQILGVIMAIDSGVCDE